MASSPPAIEERYAREYPTLQVSICGTTTPGERAFGMTLFHQSSYGSRENGNDWTGNSVYLWTVVNAVYLALLGPVGFRELGDTLLAGSHHAAARCPASRAWRWPGPASSSRSSSSVSPVGAPSRRSTLRCGQRRSSAGKDLSVDFPELGQAALYCVTELHTAVDIETLATALTEVLA